MSRSMPSRLVLLSTTSICAAIVAFSSHWPWQLQGADLPDEGAAHNQPITARGLVDVTDRVEVSVPSTLRVTGRNKYHIAVTVKNKGDDALAGPILLVIQSVEPQGLTVQDSELRDEFGALFELIAPKQTLAAGAKTRPKQIDFESEGPLGRRARRLLKLKYRVVQKVATPSDTENRKTRSTKERKSDRLNPTREPGRSSAGKQGQAGSAGNGVRLDPTQENIDRVKQVQDKWTERLMQREGIVGTATGLDSDGKLTVQVFAVNAGVKGLPKSVDGIPLKQVVTGALHARWQSTEPTNPRSRFERPVPIGVSTGSTSGGTGTISCRLRSEDGTLYSLSNNHVTSRTNRGRVGDRILQPGRGDSGGRFVAENVIGTLADFVEIRFGSHSNEVDAAITLVTADTQGTATPSNGYGTPTAETSRPRLGMRVQKYGRTTSLTQGRISSINAIVSVNYGGGRFGRFIRQIVVTGDRAGFIRGGDSGSLLVSDPGRAPVGLLFASSRGGRTAIANRIDAVLRAFDVTIDDGSTVDEDDDAAEERPSPPPRNPRPPRLPNLPDRGDIKKLPITSRSPGQ